MIDEDTDLDTEDTPEFLAWWAARQQKEEAALEKQRKYSREWKQNHSEATKLARRKTKLKSNYNITLIEYDTLLAKQDGVCRICKTDTPRGHGRFHVDHIRETGEIRGLLCCNCNLTVRNHSEEYLLRCAEYVAMKGDIL